MRIVVNFYNPSIAGGSKNVTKWNMVSFTYIVVSRNFAGSNSTIWATTVEATFPLNEGGFSTAISSSSIDFVTRAFQQSAVPTSTCQAYSDPYFVFDSTCAAGTAWDGTTLTGGGQLIVHAYFMGFQWNSFKNVD